MSDQQPSQQPGAATGQQQAAGTGQQQAMAAGQQVFPVYSNMPVTPQISPPSSGLSFKEGGLEAVSGRIDGSTGLFGSLQGKASEMGVPFPSFGVIGMGVATAHDKAIEAQSSALARGREALESWKSALKDAAANYKAAEDPPTDGPGITGPGITGPGITGPGITGPGITGPGITGPGITGPGITGPGIEGPGIEGPGTGGPASVDQPGVPKTTLPEAQLPDTDPMGTDLPKTDMPGTDPPHVDLPKTDMPGNNLPGVANPDMKVPDIDSVLNPNRNTTDLSSFNPNTPQLNGVPSADSPDVSTRTGVPLGSPTGNGVVSTSGVRAPGPALPGGMGSGMPMMPMMPMSGAGNGADERDREQAALLSEEEGVWDDDEDIAPEVIGKE
ncbi:hypothetical protein [Nonomuraea sp. NPDC050202]|uniref:hypothetical protein n=1 Tax=Nonomuraea sp. NPDC050202 TaxID=3155035 RepID=UPI0034002962